MDARPLIEFGRESYLGESRLAEQQFKVPVAETLLGIFSRDLKAAGVFRATTVRAHDVPYRVDIDIFHATASYATGLQNILPVLPTSALEAHVDIRVQFSDADGRVYLMERFEERRAGAASALGGLRNAAAQLFGEALRSVVDRAATRMMESHTEYWLRFPAGSRP